MSRGRDIPFVRGIELDVDRGLIAHAPSVSRGGHARRPFVLQPRLQGARQGPRPLALRRSLAVPRARPAEDGALWAPPAGQAPALPAPLDPVKPDSATHARGGVPGSGTSLTAQSQDMADSSGATCASRSTGAVARTRGAVGGRGSSWSAICARPGLLQDLEDPPLIYGVRQAEPAPGHGHRSSPDSRRYAAQASASALVSSRTCAFVGS